MATAVDALKTKVLTDGTKAALSLISNSRATNVLLIRRTVRTDTVDGIAPEYAPPPGAR